MKAPIIYTTNTCEEKMLIITRGIHHKRISLFRAYINVTVAIEYNILMVIRIFNSGFYSIQLFHRISDTIGYKRIFKTMTAYSGENNTRMCTLCKEWNKYLDKNSTNRSFDVGWCSFIWSFLINENIHKKYGDHNWRLLTLGWRHWWQ